MKIARVHLKSVSCYSQGRYYMTEKLPKESAADYEKRTWKDRGHYNDEGYMVIPAMAFKHCVTDAAKYLAIQIPGQGKSRYTKHFLSGILVQEPLVLPIKKEDVEGEWQFVSSGTTDRRVHKCFPIVREWEGTVEYLILDDVITKDVFEQVITEAGKLIGIGVFRPQRGGYYGRFEVLGIDWS